MTKRIIMIMAALGVLLISSPSYAKCGPECQRRCAATAHLAHNTVEECIWKWSRINARYGARASRFEGKGDWSRYTCTLQCKLKWKRNGYASAAACVADIPCSKFPEK